MNSPDMQPFEISLARHGGFADHASQLEINFARRSDELRMVFVDVLGKAACIDPKRVNWACYDVPPKFARPEDHDSVERTLALMMYPGHPTKVPTVRIISNELVAGPRVSCVISEDFILDFDGNIQYSPKTALLTLASIDAQKVPLVSVEDDGELALKHLEAIPVPPHIESDMPGMPLVFPWGDFTCVESSIESIDTGLELLKEVTDTVAFKSST